MKGVNNALSQRVRLQETEQHHPLVRKAREEEGVKLSTLQVKHDALEKQVEDYRQQTANASAVESSNSSDTNNHSNEAIISNGSDKGMLLQNTIQPPNGNAGPEHDNSGPLREELESVRRENAMAGNTIERLNRELAIMRSGKNTRRDPSRKNPIRVPYYPKNWMVHNPNKYNQYNPNKTLLIIDGNSIVSTSIQRQYRWNNVV